MLAFPYLLRKELCLSVYRVRAFMVLFLGDFRSGAGHCVEELGISPGYSISLKEKLEIGTLFHL